MRKTISFAVILGFITAITLTSCTYKVQPSELALNGEGFKALNKSSVKSKIDGNRNQFLCYGFSANQMAHFKNAVYKNSGASLSILISFNSKQKKCL